MSGCLLREFSNFVRIRAVIVPSLFCSWSRPKVLIAMPYSLFCACVLSLFLCLLSLTTVSVSPAVVYKMCVGPSQQQCHQHGCVRFVWGPARNSVTSTAVYGLYGAQPATVSPARLYPVCMGSSQQQCHQHGCVRFVWGPASNSVTSTALYGVYGAQPATVSPARLYTVCMGPRQQQCHQHGSIRCVWGPASNSVTSTAVFGLPNNPRIGKPGLWMLLISRQPSASEHVARPP